MADVEDRILSSSRFARRCVTRRGHKHDSGWAWVVVICGSLCNAFVLGCSYSFGVIYPSLLDEFKRGKAQTAWIASLGMSLTFFFGPLAGKLCDRFGARVVSIMGALVSVVGLVSTSQAQSLYVIFFTYSILFAFGGCCTYTAVFVIVPKYFLQRRSLATGMIASGPGAGTLMMSPILALSIEELGWRGAFLVMAGIVASICVLGCTFDPNTPKDTSEEHVHVSIYAKEKGMNFKLIKNTEYLLIVFTSTIVVLGNSVPQVHLGRYCEEKGISLDLVSKLYLMLGLCSVFARLLAGRLCDMITFVNRRYFFHFCLSVTGISTLLCPLATTFQSLLLYFTTFGFFDGANSAVANVLMLNAVREEQRARAFGMWLFFMSLSMASGPPLAGYIVDSTGSYAPAFYVAGSCILTGASLFFMVYFLHKEAEKETEAQNSLVVVEKVTVV